MTEQEALATLERLVSSVTNKPASLALGMDLRRDNVLDSVDSLIFFMTIGRGELHSPTPCEVGCRPSSTADRIAYPARIKSKTYEHI